VLAKHMRNMGSSHTVTCSCHHRRFTHREGAMKATHSLCPSQIYAEYVGGAFSCDAHHMTEPHPDGKGACVCV
jgi:nitrite reductase/ring-hydroxylating ferredoxin subunit